MSNPEVRESGYVPKADATRGADQFDYPQKVQKIESDQTASEVAEPQEPGGRYGDGW